MADLSKNERIKAASNYLRGTLEEGLAAPITGAIAEDDTQLTKFHGLYLQDDRDLRPERRKKIMEPAFSFMARVRLPGGVCTPAAVAADGPHRHRLRQPHAAPDHPPDLAVPRRHQAEPAPDHAGHRPGLPRHHRGLRRRQPQRDVQPEPASEPRPRRGARARPRHQHPPPAQDRAYREIWLEGEKVVGGEAEDEPIYGRTYLPRKFKTVIAVPPENDVDVFAQDLGYVAILDPAGNVQGWNVTVGGGMGMTHGEPDTYPRTADVMAFCTTEQAVDVAEKVVLVQRDYGDRTSRKHARLKYTIEDRGLAWFRAEVERRLGYPLEDPRPMSFTRTGDYYGWREDDAGNWHYTLFIENGRIKDTPERPMRTGLRKIAEIHKGDFRLTSNQNLMIASVRKRDRKQIDTLLKQHGLHNDGLSGLRRNAMACVALPTCGLALSESERYLPTLIDALDDILDEAGLRQDEIVIRMTGCPNGCARPYLAEIGLVGRGPGTYNLYLGRRLRRHAPQQALPPGCRPRRHPRRPAPAVPELCQGARGRRALRRLRHPPGRGGGDAERPRVPRLTCQDRPEGNAR